MEDDDGDYSDYDFSKINSGLIQEDLKNIITKMDVLLGQIRGSIYPQVTYLMGDLSKPDQYSLRRDIIREAGQAAMMRLPITKMAIEACEKILNLDSDYDKLIEVLTTFTGLRKPKKKDFDSLIDVSKKAVQYAKSLEKTIDELKKEIQEKTKETKQDTTESTKEFHLEDTRKEELKKMYMACQNFTDYVRLLNPRVVGLTGIERDYVKLKLEGDLQRFKGSSHLEKYNEEQRRKKEEEQSQQTQPADYHKNQENQKTNYP